MRKKISLFFAILFFPLLSFSQIDKIRLGMTLEEFHKQFPTAVRDTSSMKYAVFATDTLEGIRGSSEYFFDADTVSEYRFKGYPVSGPCKECPMCDGSPSELQGKSIQKISQYYWTIFGQPAQSFWASPDGADTNGNVMRECWKWKHETVILREFHEKRKDTGAISHFIPCEYSFEIIAKGNGEHLRNVFYLGMNGEAFKLAVPEMARNVRKPFKYWAILDTIPGEDITRLRFKFLENKLVFFDLYARADCEFGKSADSGYAVMRRQVLQMDAQAQKQFGQPKKVWNILKAKYPGVGVQKGYMARIWYDENWLVDEEEFKMTFTESDYEDSISFELKIDFGNDE